MQKNVASQKVAIYAHDTISDAAKTGDAAHITAYLSKDGGASTSFASAANPTELDSTNMPGVYIFSPSQEDTNCDTFMLYAKSSVAGVAIDLVRIETDINANITAIKERTDNLPNEPAEKTFLKN